VFTKFPYQYKKVEFGEIVNPVVRLQTLTLFGWREFKFLVDSGADVTTLPLSTSEFFGVEIDKTKKIKLGGVESKGIDGYLAQIKLRIGNEEQDVRCYFIDSEVISLLGRVDIFDQFTIIFDNEKKEIVFKKLIKEKCWFKRLMKRLRS
jgi:sRNA-binding regulator protein Hfq